MRLLGVFALASRLLGLQRGLLEARVLLGGACLRRRELGPTGDKGIGWGVRRFLELGLGWV